MNNVARRSSPSPLEIRQMAKSKEPITIKKYANRRLYNTGSSTYVTLEDLAEMVKSGDDFVVVDAKSGEDITRSVLTQIIFEQENKGTHLLPITFLRKLIRFYGDSMQNLVPSYLEFSIESFTREQQKFRDHMAQAWGQAAFGALEEQVRQNMSLFENAFRMFNPFLVKQGVDSGGMLLEPKDVRREPAEIEDLRRQLAEMRERLDKIDTSIEPKA